MVTVVKIIKDGSLRKKNCGGLSSGSSLQIVLCSILVSNMRIPVMYLAIR